ncbi:NELL2-interacting cell ontogeny regulator 1 [Lampetra planeri]
MSRQRVLPAVVVVVLTLLLAWTATAATTAAVSGAAQDGSEMHPCVDCHAFQFMQRALSEMQRAANNLNTQTEALLAGVAARERCRCDLSLPVLGEDTKT